MNGNMAQGVRPGDSVVYRGKRYTVLSVKEGMIAGPHFRLEGQGLTSYRLCSWHERGAAPEPCPARN